MEQPYLYYTTWGDGGTPGMYDIVNNTFYTNDGTGAFTVCPDIIL